MRRGTGPYRLYKADACKNIDSIRCGVVLGALGWYQPFVEFAGAGASVPLTGFGNVLVEGVKKAVDENGFIGVLTGGLTGAAGGITAAMIFALISALIFRSKEK